MESFKILDLPTTSYTEVLKVQEELFNNNFNKIEHGSRGENVLILCSHFPVYTIGKNGDENNFLNPNSAPLIHVNRGGDITFHGPGQLVVYPIFDLNHFKMGVSTYIHNLEKVVIDVLKEYGVLADTMSNAQGVWIDTNSSIMCRKIAAIGVKASKLQTMHGLAINLNVDLSWFSNMIPCGLSQFKVTSLHQEIGKKIDEVHFKSVFISHFKKRFSIIV